jgi:glucokinase
LVLSAAQGKKDADDARSKNPKKHKTQKNTKHTKKTHQSAPEITSLAAEKQDLIAVEAVDIFLSIIGAEAGHMALRALAYGGVYIAGGILPRLLNRVARGGLKDAFLMPRGRERFRQILGDIPLYIVTNTKVGLIGSRQVALGLLKEEEEGEQRAAAVV